MLKELQRVVNNSVINRNEHRMIKLDDDDKETGQLFGIKLIPDNMINIHLTCFIVIQFHKFGQNQRIYQNI